MKTTLYITGLLGLALLVGLVLRSDLHGLLHAVALGGAAIFWLIPYRLLFFTLYALGWQVLLRPYDPHHRLKLPYLTWIAIVREGIDRLLPVASVGGAVAGVRLAGWRGIGIAKASATVIVEVLLTLMAVWVFAVIGLALLRFRSLSGVSRGELVLLALGGLLLPLLLAVAMRYGALFTRLERVLSHLTGLRMLAKGADTLDAEVRATLHRKGRVICSGLLQLLAVASAAFEVWFALRLFGHPVSVRAALVMESLMQAARHVAFLVPAALGVQEITLIVVGGILGVPSDLALAVSLVKRLREIIWGVPALISWQWTEGRRLRGSPAKAS